MNHRPDFLEQAFQQMRTPPSAPCRVRLQELAQIIVRQRGSPFFAMPQERVAKLFGRTQGTISRACRQLVADGVWERVGEYRPKEWAQNYRIWGMVLPPSMHPLVCTENEGVAEQLVCTAVKSAGEAELLRQLTALGLEPQPQARPCPGRKWAYDFALPAYKLFLEVDGRGHDTPVKLAEAKAKDSYVAQNLPEWRILRLSTPEVSNGEAIRRIVEDVATRTAQPAVPAQASNYGRLEANL